MVLFEGIVVQASAPPHLPDLQTLLSNSRLRGFRDTRVWGLHDIYGFTGILMSRVSLTLKPQTFRASLGFGRRAEVAYLSPRAYSFAIE